MSLKDLFKEENTANKSLYNVNSKTLVQADDAESSLFLQAYLEDKKRIVPDLDLSEPKNFARFGSAELYYEKAFENIQKYYPYDGSKYEKLAFQNTGSILDLYILDKQYPKSKGYVSFSPTGSNYTGALTTGAQVTGFKNTTNPEYIFFKGGPNAHKDGYTSKDDIKLSRANIYKEADFRQSNLAVNMASGSTIEFWLKKEGFADTNAREMIFDLWNNTLITDTASGKPYFRMNVSCIQNSVDTITFFHQSGSVFHKADLDTGLTTIADNKWHHYAITAVNNGSNLDVSLYVDGAFKTLSTGASKATTVITGAMNATLGATVTKMNGDSAGALGYGKLSGSLDEFRYWKKARTSKQISRNWSRNIHGGTNTDTANTSLGVYYKFNEGICLTASVDQTIVDYSGRVSNGAFTGYSSLYSRNLGSAFEESGHDFREEGDPILYSFHPDVLTELGNLKLLGRSYDHRNTSAIKNMIPTWLLEEEEQRQDVVLKYLIQVMATEFDELSMLITNQNNIKNISYTSGSITGSYTRPAPYSRRLLTSHGFDAPELFTQASFFESLQDRNDNHHFTGSVDSVKDFIYNNIYNNLTAIQKSKGTERSIKNLLHCVGVDEDLIKINLYASDSVYELKNNFKTRVVKTKSLDFGGVGAHFGATAYQYTDSANSDSQNFISGTFATGSETSLGYSVETEVIFPPNPGRGTEAFMLRAYEQQSSSIFGQHTAQDNLSGNDLTFRTKDDSHFSVFAVRPELYSPHAKIVVTGSHIGEFETPEIKGLYDGDKYNIVFTVAPTKSGFYNALSGAAVADVGYEAKIYVVSTTHDQLEDLVTGSLSLTIAQGAEFLKNNKRVYLGAHYTNFTGALQTKSDAKINSCRVWMHDLDQDTIIAHNRDLSTFGTINPRININSTSDSLSGVEIPSLETLALHWGFETNTTSDASGQMTILDMSSGSAETRNRYGWVGAVSNKFHTGRADFYPANDSTAIDIDYVSSAKQSLPEVASSSDMTKVLTHGDDVIFERQSRPTNIVFAVEKSFYQSLSEELLNFFATVDDFHNLIGHPVNRYRHEYKELGKLRQLLFEKFEDVAQVEKYVNYYKWFDSSINKMIENLIPASARFSPGIANVVESHVLERNKYQSKFPTLETKASDPVATIKGIDELKYNWRHGHAPVGADQNTNQNENCFWWKNRAGRSAILSSSAAHDASKDTILSVITTDISGSGKTLVDISSGNKVKYEGLRYAHRSLSRIKDLVADNLNSSNQLNKTYENKRHSFYKTALDFEPPASAVTSSLALPITGLHNLKDCNDTARPTELNKVKYDFTAFVSSSVEGNMRQQKGQVLFPFVLMSGSAHRVSGAFDYAKAFDAFKTDMEINNVHRDIVFHNDATLQSPFTEKHVGGNQHRHIDLNTGTDSNTTRPEGWVVEISSTDIKLKDPSTYGASRPRASLLRDESAKRSVNIRNILTSTGSTTLGNYDKNYQVFQTSNRKTNNLWFVKNQGLNTASDGQSIFMSGTYDFALPVRTPNKNVFVERFSSPGSPETMGRGYLDPETEQFSVYNSMNYRNQLVRDVLSGHSGSFLTNHTEFGGYDSTFGSPTASFHKIHRNRRFKLMQTTGRTVVTSSAYDNGYIQHAIPASDRQYSWVTGSLESHMPGDCAPLGYAPASGKVPPALGATGVSRDAYRFLSESLKGTTTITDNSTWSGFVYLSGTQDLPLNHVGLNIWSYDPVTGSTNTLGLPLAAPLPEYHIGLAHPALTSIEEDSEFSLAIGLSQNYDLANSTAVATPNREKGNGLLQYAEGKGISTAGTAYTLLALNLRRNGPYGYPSWKQIRTGEHPVARWHKKNNIISYLDAVTYTGPGGPSQAKNTPGSLRHANQPPVSINHPVKVQLGGTTGLPIVYSFANNMDYFADKHFENVTLTTLQKNKKSTETYQALLDLYGNGPYVGNQKPAIAFTGLSYEECIYPPKEFMFTSHSRGRENFQIPYWRDERFDRAVPAHAYVNSMGSTIAASGTTESAPNRNPTGYSVRALVAQAAGASPEADFADPCSSRWLLDASFISGSVVASSARAGVNTIRSQAIASGLLAHGYANRQPLGFGPQRATYFLPAHQDTGELQAAYAHYHMGEINADANVNSLLNSPSSSVRLGQTINRRVMERYAGDDNIIILGGDTAWEAGNQAKAQGRSRLAAPFYQSYDDFAEDLRVIGKDYSVIPEFRISEHMDYYINSQLGDFTAPNKNFITLSGAAVDPTLTAGNRSIFSKIYSTSDFLDMFQVIANDHKGTVRPNKEFTDGSPSKITLRCKALMKFLPYEGFYPIQRAAQLGTQFSKSYGDNITTTGSQPHARTLVNPFFAPGIMYNSLKSGIACDYPIFITGSKNPSTLLLAGFSNNANVDRLGGRKTSGSFDSRIPFEGILDPAGTLKGKRIVDQEPHPSASLDSTASFGSAADPLYSLAAHNFFSEVVGFYLKGGAGASGGHRGKLTSFTSIADLDGTSFFNVEPIESGTPGEATPKEYRMRVVLHNSEGLTSYEKYSAAVRKETSAADFTTALGTNTLSGNFGDGAFGPQISLMNAATTDFINKPSVVAYERTGSHPSRFVMPQPVSTYHNVPTADLGGINYVRGSTYGPPHAFAINHGNLVASNVLSGALEDGGFPMYSPYTPSYFNGFSYLEYIFKPDRLGYHSANEILEGMSYKTVRLTEITNIDANVAGIKTENINVGATFIKNISDAMSITASINPLQTIVQPNPFFDEDGEVNSLTAESTMTSLIIQSRFECPVLDYSNVDVTLPTYGSGSVVRGWGHQYGQLPAQKKGIFMEIQNIPEEQLTLSTSTGSFADLVGFNPAKKKIGQLPSSRTVKEAIVAIPFYKLFDKMRFYKIDKEKLEGDDIVSEMKDMKKRMKNYVLPPRFDFLTNEDMDAVAMYIFEFKHTFNKRDLQNMWQALPPETLMDVKDPKHSEVSISHQLLPPDFFGPNKIGEGESALIPNLNTTIRPTTQWLIFKVKQKADKNYFNKTADSGDDSRFKFKIETVGGETAKDFVPDYSFNWPYDYFSMIELAKIDAKLDFTPF